MMSVLTQKVLTLALEELRSETTRKYINENLIVPLLKAVLVEITPYAIVVTAVLAAILLMSALSLTLIALSIRGPK